MANNHDYSSLSEEEIHSIATGYLQELEALSKASPTYPSYLSSNDNISSNNGNPLFSSSSYPSFSSSSLDNPYPTNDHEPVPSVTDDYNPLLDNDSFDYAENDDNQNTSNLSTNSNDWLPEYFANLVESARLRWLPLSEASSFLLNGAQKAVDIIYDAVGPVGPPVRPESGSLFIVDERRLSSWRDDGYTYVPMAPNVQQRPLAGIQYRDGNIYGSRYQSTITGDTLSIQQAKTTVADVLTLTFLRNSVHPKDFSSLSSSGDFLEQTIVLEWSVVNQSEWNNHTNNENSANPSAPHLQRRAIRLPRLGSGNSVLTDSNDTSSSSILQSPSQKIANHNDQGAGYIWLVQYLVDKLPPCYTPNGQPISTTTTMNKDTSPQKEDVSTTATAKVPTRRPPPKPASSSTATNPPDTESVTKSTNESLELSVSSPDTDHSSSNSTKDGGASLTSVQRREELAKQYADLSAELDAIDYNTMLQAQHLSDSPVGQRRDDNTTTINQHHPSYPEIVYPILADIDDTEIMAALHASSDNLLSSPPASSSILPSSTIGKHPTVEDLPVVPPVSVLIPPTHTIDSAIATVQQYQKDAQNVPVLPILASPHRKTASGSSPFTNPSSSPAILIGSPPRSTVPPPHHSVSPSSSYPPNHSPRTTTNVPIYDPQIVPAAEQLFPVSTIQYITNANGELVPYQGLSYHPEPLKDPLAIERRRQAAINLQNQRIALAHQLQHEEEEKLQELQRKQHYEQRTVEHEETAAAVVMESVNHSTVSKPHRVPPPVPTQTTLLPSATEYPSTTNDEYERDFGSVQGEEIAHSIENENDTASQTSSPLLVNDNDGYGIAHYKELLRNGNDNVTTTHNPYYDQYPYETYRIDANDNDDNYTDEGTSSIVIDDTQQPRRTSNDDDDEERTTASPSTVNEDEQDIPYHDERHRINNDESPEQEENNEANEELSSDPPVGYAAMFARSRMQLKNDNGITDNDDDVDDSPIYAVSPSRITKAVPRSEVNTVVSHIPGTGSYSLMHAQEIELRRSMLGNPARTAPSHHPSSSITVPTVHSEPVLVSETETNDTLNDIPSTSYTAFHQSQKLRTGNGNSTVIPPPSTRLSSSMVHEPSTKSKPLTVRLSQSSIDVYRYSDPQTMQGKGTTTDGEGTDDHLRYPRPVRTKSEAEEDRRHRETDGPRTSRKSRGRHSSRRSHSSRDEQPRRSSTSRHRRRSSRSNRSQSTESSSASSVSSYSRSSSRDGRASDHDRDTKRRNRHRRTSRSSRDAQRHHSRSSRHRSSSAQNRHRESSATRYYSSSQQQRSRTSREHHHKNRSRTASPDPNTYPLAALPFSIAAPNHGSLIGGSSIANTTNVTGQTALVNIGGRLVQVRIPTQTTANPVVPINNVNSMNNGNGIVMNTNNAYRSEVQAILEQQNRLNQLREANTVNNVLRMSNIGGNLNTSNYYRSSGTHNSFGTVASGGGMRYPMMTDPATQLPNSYGTVPSSHPSSVAVYPPGYPAPPPSATLPYDQPAPLSSNVSDVPPVNVPPPPIDATVLLPSKPAVEDEEEIEYGPYGPVRKVKPVVASSPVKNATVNSVPVMAEAPPFPEANTGNENGGPDDGTVTTNNSTNDPSHGSSATSAPLVSSPPIKSSYHTKSSKPSIHGILNGISYANIGTGQVTLDASTYGAFTSDRNVDILIAFIRGWRVRSLFKLRRIRDMRKRAMDTYRLLQQLINDTNPDKDTHFENGIRTQLAGEVNDLLVIVNDNNGERGGIELTNYLQNQLRIRNKKNKANNGKVPPETGPLITEVDEEADEEAAARGAKRAAERKSRLKGGAVGKAVMAKYSKIPVKEETNNETNDETDGNTETTGQAPVSHAPPEKPWLKARKKGKDDDNASVEDVLVVAAPKRRTNEGNDTDALTNDGANPAPTKAPPATTKKRSLLANTDAPPKEEDEHTFGSSLAPSGKWRVLIEIIAAKNLAPALYAPGTLAAGPGLKSEPITDPNALAPDPEARESYAVAYLARTLPSKASVTKTNNNNRSSNHRRGSIVDSTNPDDGGNGERYKVMGKKMQTNVASKSLAPVYKKRFLFTLPIRAGLPNNGADLPPPPSNEEEEEHVRNLCGSLANDTSIDHFDHWQIRIDILDSDRYVRDTYMGGSFINLVDMPMDKARTGWFTLQAQSTNDRVRGSVQLRYRFIPPVTDLRHQCLMDEIMGTSTNSATGSGGGGGGNSNPRLSLIDRFNNNAANENNNDEDMNGNKGNFLRRKSANLKPQKIDYSHVTAKTVTRGEGMNVPTGSQQRAGGNVRMYKMPDYSKVRSRVAIDAGLVENNDDNDEVIYGNNHHHHQPHNGKGKSSSTGNKGREKSSSRNASRRGSNERSTVPDSNNNDDYDYGNEDYSRLPSKKGKQGPKQPSTKNPQNQQQRRRDLDEELLYDDDNNKGDGGGYTRYVSYDNDLLREAALALGEEPSFPIKSNPKGQNGNTKLTNGRSSSVQAPPAPTGAASRITQEDMKKVFDRGLRSSNVTHPKDGKYKTINGPTIDPYGAIEYQPEYFQNNPTLWLDHQTMGGRSIVPPESPAVPKPRNYTSTNYSSLTNSTDNFLPTDIQPPPRRNSISSKPLDTSNSKIPRPQGSSLMNNSIGGTSGIPISYALPIHSTTINTAKNNNYSTTNPKGDIMESVGAAIDRFFKNTDTNNFSANNQDNVSPTGIPVPLPGSYASSSSRRGMVTRPMETSPTSSSSLRYGNTTAPSSSGGAPPLSKVSHASSDIPLSRDFKPVYTSNILSPELKNILFSSRVPSSTTANNTNNNSKGISELTKAAITAVQQGNDPNANAKLTEEVARFAAELRRSMKEG